MINDDDEVVTETYSLTVGRCPSTGQPKWAHIRTSDMLAKNHSPVDVLPSFLSFDEYGRVEKMEWFHMDDLHRDDGPARLWINPENGVVVSEEYRQFGKPHRNPAEGPACVYRKPDTGDVRKTIYFSQGTEIEELYFDAEEDIPDPRP